MPIELITPCLSALGMYKNALKRGYSPNNLNPQHYAGLELAHIETDPCDFIATIDGSRNQQQILDLARGSSTRFPGLRRWLMDDHTFIGSFNFRWNPNGTALPDKVPGNIGYSVAPWLRNQGYATRGLGLLLKEVRAMGLTQVDLSIEASNQASIKVALKCGAVLERIIEPSVFYPDSVEHRYGITL